MPSPALRRVLRFAALLALFVVSLAAAADPPARVGRLSFIEGNVRFHIDGQDQGALATANWPISSGAILDTGPDGRAEVQIGSTDLRVDGDTIVEFTRVDDRRIALELSRGSLAATIRDGGQAGEIEIATPAGRIRFGGIGRYRMDVAGESGNTEVSSRQGSAYVYRSGGDLVVPAGRRAVVYASGGWFLDDLRPDHFDAWADARDRGDDSRLASRYVSPEMTGYEDLNRYGDWSSLPEYGAVWYPRALPVGWAPYRHGRWAWIPPWGWTWVDSAPWGFAPFHYGRWLFVGRRWAWVPGAYVARPVYAPALVAWVGSPGWNVSFGFGDSPAVGWFPLAPREVFIPTYRCSSVYVHRANINQVSNAAAINQALAERHARHNFINHRLAQAVTVVPVDMMRGGHVINPAAVARHRHADLARTPVTGLAPAGPEGLRERQGLPPIHDARREGRPYEQATPFQPIRPQAKSPALPPPNRETEAGVMSQPLDRLRHDEPQMPPAHDARREGRPYEQATPFQPVRPRAKPPAAAPQGREAAAGARPQPLDRLRHDEPQMPPPALIDRLPPNLRPQDQRPPPAGMPGGAGSGWRPDLKGREERPVAVGPPPAAVPVSPPPAVLQAAPHQEPALPRMVPGVGPPGNPSAQPSAMERPRGHGRAEMPPAATPVLLPSRGIAPPPVPMPPPTAPVLVVPRHEAPAASPPGPRPEGQHPPGRHERGRQQ